MLWFYFLGVICLCQIYLMQYAKNVICALANSHSYSFRWVLKIVLAELRHAYFFCFAIPFDKKIFLKNNSKALRDNLIVLLLCHALKTTPFYKSLDLMDFFCKHFFKFPLRRKHVHWVLLVCYPMSDESCNSVKVTKRYIQNIHKCFS